MNRSFILSACLFFGLALSHPLLAEPPRHGEIKSGKPVTAWDESAKKWVTPKQFWLNYASSRGGLTWGEGRDYPPYGKVKEHDTFLVILDSGSCLMEFFHSRWRRANDVKRWDPKFNEYGGCPDVFR